MYLDPNHALSTITEGMKRMGLTSRKGRPFAQSHVQKILTNPFYIGINRFDGKDYPGAQEHLIERSLLAKNTQRASDAVHPSQSSIKKYD